MSKTLKEKTASALFWNFMDKGGQQLLQFSFLFILARLLSPQESGLIALLSIFVAIANILQESGFSSALIRKSNADESDYSSIFYFNIGISIIIYLILFFSCPLISRFYSQPVLTNLSRFLFLVFLFNAFGIVQNIQLIKKMDFKTNAQITLASVLISGVVAVIMAYKGYSVWSLAVQQVLQAFLRTIFLWIVVKWIPEASFCFDCLKSMYNYSSKLLLNSLFNQIAGNISSIVIGKKYSIVEAGNYWQSYKLGNIPQSVIATSLSGVTFPLLNNLGDDVKRKNRAFRKIVRIISFICFPLFAFTVIGAESIVLVLLDTKWVGVIPILRLLAIGSSVLPLLYVVTSLLQSLGKSGLLLTMESCRNVVTILVILFMSRYGINEMILGTSVVAIVTFFVEYYIAGKLINYKMKQILKDISPYVCISAVIFFPLHFLSKFIDNHFVLLLLQGGIGVSIYLVVLKCLGSKVMDDLIRVIKKKPLD